MRFLLGIFFFLESVAFAYSIPVGPSSYAPDVLEAGPELCFLRRIRKGGTRQQGHLEGAFANYDFLRKQTLYFGATWQESQGEINGATGRGALLKSDIHDRTIEGRLGFTLQHPSVLHTFFTPFVGCGSFRETNRYIYPSPLSFMYLNSYEFFSIGFLSGADLNDYLGFWIKFQVRFMLNGTAQIQDDPIKEDCIIKMNNELSFRLDTPFIFSPKFVCYLLKIAVTPFYEFRHYGGRLGYPYNYYDTKMNLIGARGSLMFRF